MGRYADAGIRYFNFQAICSNGGVNRDVATPAGVLNGVIKYVKKHLFQLPLISSNHERAINRS